MSGAGPRQVAAAKILRTEVAALLETPKNHRCSAGHTGTQSGAKAHALGKVLGTALSAALPGGCPA